MIETEYPQYLQERITYQFLISLKNEINKEFADDILELEEEPTYYNFYTWRSRSSKYYKAIKITCELHDFIDLYNFLQIQGCCVREALMEELLDIMCNQVIITEGSLEDIYPVDFDLPDIYLEDDILEEKEAI